MHCQTLLEKQARDRDLALTPLAEMGRLSHSQKVPCCGGAVVRVETESSADSTVCLRDGSGTCFCALHGDLTSRYPDVLTAGALLFFTDITLLVTSAKMPPLLVACLHNLAGLMLPDEDTAEDAAAASTRQSCLALPETPLQQQPLQPSMTAVAGGEAAASSPLEGSHSESLSGAIRHGEAAMLGADGLRSAPPNPVLLGDEGMPSAQQLSAAAAGAELGVASPPARAAVTVKAETISDDDEDCLELVDDM